MKSIYVIGSLANPEIIPFANRLRKAGIDAFDEWICGGPTMDRCWEEYEKARGRTFIESLEGYHESTYLSSTNSTWTAAMRQ